MRVLILGKDAALADPAATMSDAWERHRGYAAALRAACGDQAEIRVVVQAPPGLPERPATPGLRIIASGTRWRPLFIADAVGACRSALRGWRPDLITAQEPWEEGLLALALARLHGAVAVAQLHCDVTSAHFRAEHWSNPLRTALARRVVRASDAVRLVSTHQQRTIVERWHLPLARTHVVPIGADDRTPTPDELSAFRARAGLPDDGVPVVLGVGRLVEAKNLPLWLEVAATVSRRGRAVRWVLAGAGHLRAALEARAADLGVTVHFLGAVAPVDMPSLYRCAAVLLLTSDHEGFGRVAAEAHLAGVPVVTTACGGPEDVVVDGVTGAIRPLGDGAQLGEALAHLLDDAELRRRQGASARERAVARFTRSAQAAALIACWRTVAQQAAR